MIDQDFWKEVKSSWKKEAIQTVKIPTDNNGNAIASVLLRNPWEDEEEEIPFDMIDCDEAFQAALSGEMYQYKTADVSKKQVLSEPSEKLSTVEETPAVKEISRPQLDVESFERELDKKTINGFVQAAQLLQKCNLPESMDSLYNIFLERMSVLETSIQRFAAVYTPDMDSFYDIYFPEVLQLTASYLEFINIGIEKDIIQETEIEIVEAIEKINLSINEIIGDIYKYSSIEIKAKAKALEAMMAQEGYVDSEYRL